MVRMQKLRLLSPLHRATRQIHLHLEKEVGAHGIANNEGHLLTYLLSYGPVSIAELLRVFGFKRSTMTSMLDRLEKSGMLVRNPNTDDRRSWLVELTAEGKDKAREVRRIVDRFEDEVICRIGPETLEAFQRVIDMIGEVTAVEVRRRG